MLICILLHLAAASARVDVIPKDAASLRSNYKILFLPAHPGWIVAGEDVGANLRVLGNTLVSPHHAGTQLREADGGAVCAGSGTGKRS